jgi:ABC-type multidrug transport system ATPase subunit
MESLDDHLASESAESGLIWHNLSLASILKDCSGSVANGQLAGVLGPSGSGKTTFLMTLAGLCEDRNVQGYSGAFEKMNDNEIFLHKIPSRSVAYLQDTDFFFSHLTVRETLHLALFLESPQLSISTRQRLVQQSARQLGLEEALDRLVGDPSSRSVQNNHEYPRNGTNTTNISLWHGGGRLSHGERRRLSVGLELLTSKQLLLADEPTTGLDSSFSHVVVGILKELARSHHIPAILSLHQPRSSIWNSLDYVLLLAPGGRVCYSGCRDDVIEYFEKQFQCAIPQHTNPAEWLVDLVSITTEHPEEAKKDCQRIENFNTRFLQLQRQTWEARHKHDLKQSIHFQRRVSANTKQPVFLTLCIRRLGALFLRSWRQNVSTPTTSSIADRVSLLSFSAICFCMMSYIKAITLLSREKPIVQREHDREQYSMAEYLIAKVFAEVPLDILFSTVFTTTLKQNTSLHISWGKLTASFALLTAAGASIGFFLGSIAPTSEHASTSGIPILVVLMAVGMINPNGMAKDLKAEDSTFPKIVQCLRPLSPFAYAVEALCFGEFQNVEYEKQQRRQNLFQLLWSPVKNARKEILREMAVVQVLYSPRQQHMLEHAADGIHFCRWILQMYTLYCFL